MEEDQTPEHEYMTPEEEAFLDEPMSRLEVIQLVQPLRATIIPLFQASMTSLMLHISQSSDQKLREKAKQSFDDLHPLFQEIEKFDTRITRLFKATPTWQVPDEDSERG